MSQQEVPLVSVGPTGLQGSPAARHSPGSANALAQSGQIDVLPHGCEEGGTVAALCTDQAGKRSFALTCGHLFLDLDPALLANIDLCEGGRLLVSRGRVGECSPKASAEVTPIDAALVELAPETARTLALAYPDLRPRAAASAELVPGTSLTLRCARGPIRGVLGGQQANLAVATAASGTYTLLSVYSYRTLEQTQPGDSGAAVWDDRGRLVGIHCGAFDDDATGRHAFFCGIDKIVEAFRIRILTQERRSEANETLAPMAIPAPTPGETAARELEIVARTIWGEAGDLGVEAMRAVAAVILNRRTHGKWWGRTAADVCLRPYQFRCWDASSPTIQQMRSGSPESPTLTEARSIAEEALTKGFARDPSKRATHYHPEWVIPVPAWASGKETCERVAGLFFYNDID